MTCKAITDQKSEKSIYFDQRHMFLSTPHCFLLNLLGLLEEFLLLAYSVSRYEQVGEL